MRWLTVVLLCLIAGIGAGGWWLQRGEPDAPPSPPEQEADRATDDQPPEVASPEAETDAPVADAPTTDGESMAGEAEPERTDAVEATSTDGPLVLVVRGPLAEPVAGADVFHLTLADGEARNKSGNLGTSSWPEEWGQRLRTDVAGTARLPPARSPWLVAARSGDEFAFARVPRGRRAVTLALEPDETLSLATLTVDRDPVPGIPVTVVQQIADGDPRHIWDGATGPDGKARVPHFQLLRQRLPDPAGKAPPPERFAVLATVACAPPALTTFDGRPAPREPVSVFVPALGTLEVLLTDHTGTPLLSPATVGAVLEPRPQLTDPIKMPPGAGVQRVPKTVGDAPVLLPFLGLSASLRLFARFEGNRANTHTRVTGPETTGTAARRTLPLGPDQVVVAGRLRTPDGAPVARERLASSLWSAGRDVARPTIHTVADGRFDLVLPGRPDAERHELEIRRNVPATDDRAAHETGARVALPSLAGGRRVELGDVVLAELAPLVSGIVVDDLDVPVAEADVRVQRENPVAPDDRNRNRDPWRDLPHLQTRTAADGTFVLSGARPDGSLRVRADTDAHFADSLPLFAAGATVRIRIQRNGVLRGRVLLPDWLAEGTVSLTVQRAGEANGEGEARRVDLSRRAGGRFRIDPLRPGRHDAIVQLRNQKEPLAIVQDVFVQPGDAHDPRLDPLDLRQALFRYRLRAVDARGTPVATDGPILLRTQTLQGNVAEAGFRWRGGRAEVIAASAVADFQFFGRGVQPTRLSLSPGDHDVFLPTLRPAALELPGARALCGPTRRVRVSVILTEPTGLPESLAGVDQRSGEQFSFPRWDLGKSSGAWLGADDFVEVPLMKSGKYEVILRAHATDSERSAQASLSLGTFELVADAVQARPVVVRIDGAALEQMLAGLDARHAAQAAQAASRPR